LYIAYGGFDSSYYLRAFIELSQLDRSHVSARKLAHSYHAFSRTSLTALQKQKSHEISTLRNFMA